MKSILDGPEVAVFELMDTFFGLCLFFNRRVLAGGWSRFESEL